MDGTIIEVVDVAVYPRFIKEWKRHSSYFRARIEARIQESAAIRVRYHRGVHDGGAAT